MWNIGLSYTKFKSGTRKLASALKPFDIEFQPFIQEINAKERTIREWAGAATMERIKSTALQTCGGDTIEPKSNANI